MRILFVSVLILFVYVCVCVLFVVVIPEIVPDLLTQHKGGKRDEKHGRVNHNHSFAG